MPRRYSKKWCLLFCLLLVLSGGFACFQSRAQASKQQPNDGLYRSGPIVGIDLGATNSRVAIMNGGQVEVITDKYGNGSIPSYLAFTNDDILLGASTKDQYHMNPSRAIFDFKSSLGRKFREIQKVVKELHFNVVDRNDAPRIQVEVGNELKEFSSEEITVLMVGRLKDIAENYLEESIIYAVITVPASFDMAQSTATKEAGAIAGLNVLRILNEPTAAALAYRLDVASKDERHILVYKLGGKNLDISILSVEYEVFEILATAVDSLGGEDLDQQVVDHLVRKYDKGHKVDVREDFDAMRKLKREVERAKCELSSQMVTKIEIEGFHLGNTLSETLTRARFEKLNDHLFKRTLKTVKRVLKEAELKKSDIDDVILIGGVFMPVTKGGSVIPTRKTLTLSSSFDNQETVLIQVYEGDSNLTKWNNLIGTLKLRNIRPASAGVLQIEVTFELDLDGILKVSAIEKPTGKSSSMTITGDNHRLTQEHIERLVEQAELFLDDDRSTIERMRARNSLENYAYLLKRQVNNEAGLGQKIDERDRKAILDDIKELEDWLDENFVDGTKEEFQEREARFSGVASGIKSKAFGGIAVALYEPQTRDEL